MKLSTLTLMLLIWLVQPLQAQDFTELVTDVQGDPTQPFGLDAKSLSVAFDEANDSIWFRIETYDSIHLDEDWGLAIAIDTNENPADGEPWNKGNNTSMGYERLITFLNNFAFPPTFTSLVDHHGNSITTSIHFTIPDPFTLVMNLKLSDIDSDTKMNIVAGTGSFTTDIYDDLPDSTFVNTGAVGIFTHPAASYHSIRLYPNPVNDVLNIESDELANSSSYRIYSVDGRLVLEGTLRKASSTQVDISVLEPGMYLLHSIHAEKGDVLHSKRFVIAR